MKIKTVLFVLIAVSAVAVLLYSLSGNQSPQDYAKEIQKERDAKDDFMQTDKDSPFVGREADFRPLKYFAPDLKYVINATLTPITNKKMVALPTSDGNEKRYLEYAHAGFVLEGKEIQITILEITDSGPHRGTLFLAFADDTSAKETYGAGRYLDLKKIPGASSIVLDFNKAYNPYCAYSGNYSCPFPPKENTLSVAIRAGEKSYH